MGWDEVGQDRMGRDGMRWDRMGWDGMGRAQSPPVGGWLGGRRAGAHLHPAFDPHRQHVVVETLCLEAAHFVVQLDLLPLETLQPVQEDGGLREKLRGGGRGEA